MQYEFFNWLFQLKSDQILFVFIVTIISITARKMYQIMDEKNKKLDKKDEEFFKLMEEQRKKIDEKDEKILELIDRVNNSQIEIVKTMESIKSKSDFYQSTIVSEFKLLRTKLNHLEDKIDEIYKIK